MSERKYNLTTAELIDRLSIVLMKSIFIPENRDAYRKEITDIKHDIGMAADKPELIYAILVLMLANRYIWENESAIRTTPMGACGYEEIAHKLIATHSINGVRNAAKNIISEYFGEKKDLKTDCLAADLPPQVGNWNVFANDSEVRAAAGDGGGTVADAEREQDRDRFTQMLRGFREPHS